MKYEDEERPIENTERDEIERPADRPFYVYSRPTIWVLIACLVGVFVAAVLFWNERQKLAKESKAPSDASMERQELAGANLAKIGSKVYFRQAGAQSLLAMPRDIFATTSPEVRARQLVQALIEGPQQSELGKVFPVLPRETKVRQIYFLGETAVVDLSEEVASLLPGGIDSEATAMDSIQQTLLENVAQIKAVHFLINGKDTEAFAGHIALQ
ncbi:MAG TPA: GerMN domain-containing protein [Acidobacteriota bacterium]|jgi:spore germination protein GerM|nr:GerMN domain-containing protein [Acidobacteriota bacterium]